MRQFAFLDSVAQDIRYGVRSLRRSLGFTTVAVVSIAGGLAAGTAIFAAMNAFVFRPVAVGDPAGVHRIFTSGRDGGNYGGSSYADLQSFMEAGVLESACGIDRARGTLTVAGKAELHEGEIVTPGCFSALQITPSLGRLFGEDEAASSAVSPIVLSHRLWQRRFGGDPAIVGRTILLNGVSVGVVGIAPAGFAGTNLDGGAEFWAPIAVAPAVLGNDVTVSRGERRFTVLARLKAGVTRERAEAALGIVASRLQAAYPEAWTDNRGEARRVTVMREVDARFVGAAPGARTEIVLGTILAVLVIVGIACVNLATMLLARGAVRAREFAVRLALGASRRRVLRQLATESLIIASMGVALALAIVAAGLRIFETNRPAVIPAVDVALDWRVLSFAAAIAVAASLLFGLAPAFSTLRMAAAEGMKGPAAAARGRWSVTARGALIVTQVSVSMALLLISTLFGRALASRTTASPGFETDGVVVMRVELEALPDSERTLAAAKVLEAGRRAQGIDAVTLSAMIPLTGSNTGFEVTHEDGTERVIDGNVLAPGYFSMLRIPLKAGRDFAERDRRGTTPVAIVNETMARTTWGSTDVVGRTLKVARDRVEIIGVVADTRYRTLSEKPRPLIYRPITQSEPWRVIVHARMRADGEAMARLENAARRVDRRLGVEAARPLRAQMDEALAPERITRMAGGGVGAVQLFLAMMALWGLVAYSVARRTSEMGIRLALGATPASLVRLIVRPAGKLIVIGSVIGTAAGLAIATVIQSQSAGLAPLDPVAGLPIAIGFAAVALTAAWWPARRAGLADPARSLRAE